MATTLVAPTVVSFDLYPFERQATELTAPEQELLGVGTARHRKGRALRRA